MARFKLNRNRKEPRQSEPAAPSVPQERVEELTARGIECASNGDLAGAVAMFLEAVRLRPDLPHLQGNLGNIFQMLGDPESAAAHYRKALEISPGHGEVSNNLAVLLHRQKRSEEAIDLLRSALDLNPAYYEALVNLGNVLQDTGDLEGARECYRRALESTPGAAAALRGLGNVALRRQDYQEALDFYREAEKGAPHDPELRRVKVSALVGCGLWREGLELTRELLDPLPEEIRGELGEALERFNEERFSEGVELMKRVLAPLAGEQVSWDLEPVLDALPIVNRLLAGRDRMEEREGVVRLWVALQPESAVAHLELGILLHGTDREEEAIIEYAQALKRDPECSQAWTNLCRAFIRRGRLEDARATIQRSLELDPTNSVAHSNLIFVDDIDERCTSQEGLAERQRWWRSHGAALAVEAGHYANIPDPTRRLRVGYVSGDFRQHSAAFCLAGVVCSHDPGQVEVVCYSNYEGSADTWTKRFRCASSLWRDVQRLSDRELSETIRADGIDILVDLSGHSARNRLLTFARKPAPVQVSAWGYSTGTGLQTMDYLFTDAVCMPPETQQYYVEKFWYLPCIICYDPPRGAPPVAPLPSADGRGTTFGCLNRIVKVTREALRLWAAILHACPGSRLLLKDTGFNSPEAVARTRAEMESLGIEPSRLLIRGGSSQYDHLAAYHDVDIALDPFPQGGGITTLEGLWMGVPAITMLGTRKMQERVTSSFMTVLGLEDFVARSRDEYVQVAVARAQELQRLVELRQGMRARMQASPLMGGRLYCQPVEAAYREMWRRWCASPV